jgi:hypothetical protein
MLLIHKALGIHLVNVFGARGPGGVDGEPVNTSDVEVRYTYYGDANLDGHVDGSDYSRIDNGFLHHLTGWSNGDFNYDNVVNGSDYTLIDNAFNSQGASLASQIAQPQSEVVSPSLSSPGANAAGPNPRLTAVSSQTDAWATTQIPGEESSTAKHRSLFQALWLP